MIITMTWAKSKIEVTMKKTFITIGIALLTLVACNKETELKENPKEENNNTAVLVFSSDRPQIENGTKTAWDGGTNSIVWSSGDKIRVGWTLGGTWMAKDGPADLVSETKVPAKFYASNSVAIDGGDASMGTFTVPTDFSYSPIGEAVFYGIYPSSCTGSDSNFAPSLTVNIPSGQTPAAESFDGSADIMVGKTDAVNLTGELPTSPIGLNWNRIVAHADLTFTNLAIVDDSGISKITLTFNEDAKVAGSFYVNVTNGDITTNSSSSNVVSLSGANLSLSGSSVEAWACVRPVTFTSLTVQVKTDKATYSRTITGLNKTFKKNARNALTINMSSATRTLNTNLIDNGNYVLVAKSGDKYYAISSDNNATSTRRDRAEITINPDSYSTLSPYTADNKLIWTITNVTDGVKINVFGDTNSYMKYDSNKLPLDPTGTVFEVAEGTGTYTFSPNTGRFISMNDTYGFGCYDSNVSYIKDLYVIPATGTPTLTFTETSKNVAANAPSVSFSYTTLFLSAAPTVAVTTDEGNAVESTSIADGTLTVNLNENTTSSDKSITLTVSATGVSDVVLTITQLAAVSNASYGDVLWEEHFTGCAHGTQPSVGTVLLYGGGYATYSYSGTSNTKIYATGNLNGTPEILIDKSSRGETWTVSGIPTAGCTEFTLSYSSNQSLTIAHSGVSVIDISNNGNNWVKKLVVDGTPSTFSLTFSMSTDSNARLDDIVLSAGAPVPGVSVTTTAATLTETAEGTTATINATLAAINGGDLANITSAGFYYKKTSAAGDPTRVTVSPAASISKALTGLEKDAEYTFYAFASYNGGDEVLGSPLTFTPTVANAKTYTFTIEASGLVINDSSQSSAYAKYAGNQTFTATATDSSGDTIDVTVVVFDVMPATGTNTGKLQIRKGSYIYNSTNLGSVGTITVADGVSMNTVKGSTENPSSGTSGAFFKVTKTSNNAAYPTNIVVTFTK